MIKARTLGRLGMVKVRVERVRRAELAEAMTDRDRALDARNAIDRVADDLRNPLASEGIRSARDFENIADLIARARADLLVAEAALRDREATCEVRRAASLEAARESKSLERATARVASCEARELRNIEDKNADDRSSQRWRPS